MSSIASLTAAGILCLALVPQSMQRVATLRTARSVHTATALATGEVLVVGGMTAGGGSLGRVELFDPVQATTAEVASLATPRAGHTATRLADGRVLVAGGYNGDYLASVEIYDPATKRFLAAGSLREGRSGHTATLLPDGRLLLAGGVGAGWTFLRTAELYDPQSGRAELTGSMSTPRESHTATLLADGRVLIVGGHSGRRPNQQLHAGAELFDSRTGRFEAAGTLATPRHKHDAIRLVDGRVLIIGGADSSDRLHYATTEAYAPRSATFEPGPSMAHRRYKIAGTSILLGNGDVLVTSGAPVAERLDVTAWAFRDVAGRLPDAYRFAAAALLPGGEVIVTGGYTDANRNTDGVWRFR
jgi:hypothetical protein